MSQTAYPAEDRELLSQLVTSPGLQDALRLPVFAWQEILMVMGVYGSLILSIAAYMQGWSPLWLTMTINAIAIYMAFTPFHDAAHSSVSSNRKINDLIGTASVLPLFPGFTTGLYRFLHLEHHRYTGEGSRDPDDVLVSAPIPLRVLAWTFIDVYWVVWYLKRWRERALPELIRDGMGAVLFIVIHVGFLTSAYAWEFIFLWLIPQRIGMTFLTYMFAAIQHPHGVVQAENPIQGTRMIKGGWLMRYACISQSQHLMHHLFPGVPYYRYNQAWNATRNALERERELVWSWPVGKLTHPAPQPPSSSRHSGLLKARVTSVERVSPDICAFTLEPVDAASFPAYEAGAHIDLHLPGQVIRQYSLCSALRADGRYRIAVKREDAGRGGSVAVHATLVEGAEISISYPRNHFALESGARSVVLVSGGIGITPMLAMAETLEQKGTPFQFHVCARTQSICPFSDELAEASYRDRVKFHFDDGTGLEGPISPQMLGNWMPGTALYICGPAGFMRHVSDTAIAQGWPTSDIHTESFSAPQIVGAESNQPFEAVLRQSGFSVEVPADKSLLDVLTEHKIPDAVAVCTQGLCGSCALKVVEGEVEHRDVVLSQAQRDAGYMTACVSRATGKKIIIDV